RHTRWPRDWSSDVCSSDLGNQQEGAVKLLDFGVARASGALKLAQTAHSMIVGTPSYMSPEAFTGIEVDGRSDVYSLGAVLFEMQIGRASCRERVEITVVGG